MKMRIPLFIILFVGLASALTNVNSCMNLDTPGELYNITADFSGHLADDHCLNISVSNIILEGNGFTIGGDTFEPTVYANGVENIIVRNCILVEVGAGGRNGLKLNNTNNSYVFNNTINTNSGIRLGYSHNNNLTNNVINGVDGTCFYSNYGGNNTFFNNTVRWGEHGFSIVDSAGSRFISNTFLDTGFESFSCGGCSDTTITNNRAVSPGTGFEIVASSNNITLIGNTVEGSGLTSYGFILYYYTDNITLINNTALSATNGDGYGFWLAGNVRNNTLLNNTANYNNYGFYIKSSNNTLKDNTAISNVNYGIYLDSPASDNLVYNNYLSNTNNAFDLNGTNHWNTSRDCSSGPSIISGPCIGGNYYSDYTGIDTDGDGIGETNYPIAGGAGAMDYLPLVSCPVINTPNIRYNLTYSMTGQRANGRCIEINADNVTLDCMGHSITTTSGGTTYGVYVSGDDYVKVENCDISGYRYGIYFRSVHDGLMYNNNVSDGYTGIYMGYSGCYNNTIHRNIVTDCTGYGVRTTGSPYSNLIYDNYLSFNADNAYDSSGGNNFWNTSYNCTAGPSITGGNCIGGNYYNDYFGVDDGSGVYPHDVAGDGIGDNPPEYTVHGGVKDYLPLVSTHPSYRNITTCTDITVVGEYRLSADLVGNQSNGACIRITSDHITLDCQSRKITGDSTGTTYGVYVSGDDYAIVKNCEISDYRYGIYYRSVYSGTIEDNTIDSCDYGTYLGYSGCGRNVVEGNEIIGSSVQGIRLLSGAPFSNITNNEIHDGTGIGIYTDASDILLGGNTIHGHSGYALILNNTPNMIATGTSIYNQTQYLYVSGATNNFADLALGYDERTGLINYPNLVLNSVNITDANLILARDFVSLNASDPNAAEMNDTANITLYTPGCGSIKYYMLDGFPTTRNEIVANGTNFTPILSQCAGTLATFEVPSFSGYAVTGMAPPSGGHGAEKKTLTVSHDVICPDNIVEITVTYKGSPAVGAEVDLAKHDPYMLVGTETTDSDGKVQFTILSSGSYRATIDKDGYYYMNPYSFDYTMCGGAAAPECETNADCADDEYCSAGECISVESGECGYIANHQWIEYECCADSDCAEGYACEEHTCVLVEEEAPPEEEQPPAEEGTTQEEAQAALDDAAAAIADAGAAGKDVSLAQAYYNAAQEAFDAGDYESAMQHAQDATDAAGAVATPKEPEVPEEEAEEGFPWMLLLGIIVVIGGIAALSYWFLTRSRKGRRK